MHSSRMRTVRNSSCLLGGACSRGEGVCSGGGCLLPGVCLLLGGGGIPACTEAEPPPCGQTDRCKNITFTTSLQTVISQNSLSDYCKVLAIDKLSLPSSDSFSLPVFTVFGPRWYDTHKLSRYIVNRQVIFFRK